MLSLGVMISRQACHDEFRCGFMARDLKLCELSAPRDSYATCSDILDSVGE